METISEQFHIWLDRFSKKKLCNQRGYEKIFFLCDCLGTLRLTRDFLLFKLITKTLSVRPSELQDPLIDSTINQLIDET